MVRQRGGLVARKIGDGPFFLLLLDVNVLTRSLYASLCGCCC